MTTRRFDEEPEGSEPLPFFGSWVTRRTPVVRQPLPDWWTEEMGHLLTLGHELSAREGLLTKQQAQRAATRARAAERKRLKASHQLVPTPNRRG
jgi:hypothetical protein